MTDDPVDRGVTPIAQDSRHASLPAVSLSSRATRPSPIFLHSSFRSGSTWLWQKMREVPTTLAYYEIFNEGLQTLTPEQARRIDFSAWPSKHPISSPYFLEFLPLIGPGGGLPGFDRSMGIEGVIPCAGPDGELTPSEHAHVDKLITAAWSQRRIPVLSCTRTLGRARILRRAFGGQTILLHRNLFHQWSSYCFQAENGNAFFVDTMCRIILAAEHDPYLQGLVSWFGWKDISPPARETLFPVFVLLHLYLYSIAFDAADLIVDVTEIAADGAVRRDVERDLSQMVGYPISLSDARSSCEPASVDVDCPRKMRDTIGQFAKLIPAASMSADASRFVDQTKEKLLEEWDRYEFFTRPTRTILTRRIDDTAARVEEQRHENARLGAEIERLTAETAEVSRLRAAEREAHGETIRRLTEERDALSQNLSASETLRADRDQTVAELSAGRGAYDETIRRLTEERDTLSQNLSASEASRADLDKAVTELSAERETAIANATAGAARQEGLERALAEAKADLERSLLSRLRQHVSRKAGRQSS